MQDPNIRSLLLRYSSTFASLGYNTKLFVNQLSYFKTTTGEVGYVGVGGDTIIKARLNQQKEPMNLSTGASDRDLIFVAGYLVSPKAANYELDNHLRCQHLISNRWVNCEFHPIASIEDNLNQHWKMHGCLGQFIQGFLKLQSVSNN